MSAPVWAYFVREDAESEILPANGVRGFWAQLPIPAKPGRYNPADDSERLEGDREVSRGNWPTFARNVDSPPRSKLRLFV